MSGNIIWKFVLTIVLVGWCALFLVPIQDTPFETYIRQEVSANEDEFAELMNKGEANVQKANELLENRSELSAADESWADQNRTLFLTLRYMGQEGEIDLYEFYPEINVGHIKNLPRRNTVLLNELLKRSKSLLQPGLDLRGGVAATLSIPEASIGDDAFAREQNLGKAIDVIKDRVDGLGVAEPVIRPTGERSIELQMPGITTKDNPEMLTEIGKPARLEFRMVHPTRPPPDAEVGSLVSLPNDPQSPELGQSRYEVMELESENKATGEVSRSKLYVKARPEAEGDIVEGASPRVNQIGGHEIVMDFTGDEFYEITSANVGRQLAIVLDGKLYSAPNINSPIRESGQITGDFDQLEAIQLANVLNNPLAIPLEVEELYEVGPTLAESSLDASVTAATVGATLVIAFMIIYYGVSGVIAVISIILNITIVLGVLASVGATITLPGVAALVLTVGMAVDAQILIFERIREELNAGKKIQSALQAGYEKAFSTIVDANVTTLITAAILFWLGTGAVKGFGLTLGIGIAASMFCALVATRAMLELVVYGGLTQKILLLNTFRISKMQFLNYRKKAFTISWIIIAIGAAVVLKEGKKTLSIDFLGGNSLMAEYSERLSVAEIEDVAAAEGLGEVQANYKTEFGTGEELLVLQTEAGDLETEDGQLLSRGQILLQKLQAAHPEAELEYRSEELIGAAVSHEIAVNAVLSVGFALLCILLYVALRFELGYGIGAVVATVHDVLMTIGMFVVLGNFLGMGSGQFTAPMVAAILMIVGYSLNDTIVVFDRIREELELNPTMKLFDVVNLAVNRTLSRTILTSVTTLLAALSLFIFGAGVVVDYALVFLVGILTGTFSSIFIASPVFYWWHKGDRKHVTDREILPKYEWDSSTKASKEEPAS